MAMVGSYSFSSLISFQYRRRIAQSLWLPLLFCNNRLMSVFSSCFQWDYLLSIQIRIIRFQSPIRNLIPQKVLRSTYTNYYTFLSIHIPYISPVMEKCTGDITALAKCIFLYFCCYVDFWIIFGEILLDFGMGTKWNFGWLEKKKEMLQMLLVTYFTQQFRLYLFIKHMRKNSGIIRNKITFLQQSKTKISRKKNRFQSMNKNDESFETSTPNSSTEQGMNMASELQQTQQVSYKDVYDKAKNKLAEVTQIQKKMLNLSKARLTSFKEREYEKYDENISKLASEATNLLFEADKCLKHMNQIQRKSSSDQKRKKMPQFVVIQNMSKSLASQIRQISKNLRQQQKQYFDTIRSYQKNSKNTAIELSQQQKQIMKSVQQEMQEETNDLLNNRKVDELVKNINKLSTIYKELNNLVIQQGSLIDRIDVNIDATLTHTKQAVVHLEAADQHASSPLADRIMKMLIVMIMVLAVILGLKWAA